MLSYTDVSTSPFLGNRTRTILVVEDEDPIRAVMVEFLQDCGHRVIEASDAVRAKDLLAKRQVDLVFSDINMPGGETGFALEKWVRRHYPSTKVLLTSGFPHVMNENGELIKLMIPKPYRLSTVLERIETLLRL